MLRHKVCTVSRPQIPLTFPSSGGWGLGMRLAHIPSRDGISMLLINHARYAHIIVVSSGCDFAKEVFDAQLAGTVNIHG